MAHCLKCSSALPEDGETEQLYFISNMSQDIIDIIEQLIGSQVDINGIICQQCFNDVTNELSHRYTSLQHDTNVCVWCRSSLFQRRRHDLPEGPVRNEIATRIYPREIPNNALVCYNCWRYVYRLVQDRTSEHTASVNTNVCVWCSASLNTRRTHSLPEGPERDLIAERITPRQIPLNSRVCYACWVRAQRNVRREQQETEQLQRPGTSTQRANECTYCRVSLFQRQTRLLGEGQEREIVSARIFPRQVPAHPLVCVPCWRRVQLIINSNNQHEIEPENIDNNIMELDDFKHTSHSNVHCFVPECNNSERHRVPGYLKKRILKTQKLYVSDNARVCQQHIIQYDWDFLSQYQFSNSFTKAEIQAMLLCFNEDEVEENNFNNLRDMPDNMFQFWTGITKVQFENLFGQLPSLHESCKYPEKALGLFLIKAHTGESHDRLASLFQKSKASISRLLKNAREALLRDFVPLHLGINQLSREDLILKNLKIPEGLFGDRVTRRPIIIFDGTYIYLQKSSNYMFQKQTYSLHKFRNLIKPFLLVAPDGHILDVFGPYPATLSDSDIMKSLFQNENSILRRYFRPNDIFILDRGFRDSIPLLEGLGYKVYKPENILPGDTQLTTINANKTRYVTLCRWVVEVINGRFKNEFKLFRAEYFNLASTHLMDDFRICAAIINAYHVKLRDRPDAEIIINRAVERFNVPNCLADYIIENNINRRRAQFSPIDSQHEALDIFPQMTMSDLELFALGVYQIRQARSYYGEHLRQNGSFEVEIASELEISNVPGLPASSETVLLRGRIKSRHISNKIYYTYILIDKQGHNWDEKIIQYYCSCICGRRTVGCCAHTMTIVWYLGWARHQQMIRAPASFLNDVLLIREENE